MKNRSIDEMTGFIATTTEINSDTHTARFKGQPLLSLPWLPSALLCLTLALFLYACAPSEKVTTRQISSFRYANSENFKMVSKNPTVYSFDLPNLNGHIFLTELNKCGRTHTSPASALRQLFVEIDTKIIDKRPVGSKENSFRYLAESSIDGSKIWIAAYTTIKGNCLRDFIFWGKASEIPLASFKEQLHSFEEIITSLSGEKTL